MCGFDSRSRYREGCNDEFFSCDTGAVARDRRRLSRLTPSGGIISEMPESFGNMIYVLLVSIAVVLSIFCGIQMDRHHWRGIFRGRKSGGDVPRPMLLPILLRKILRAPTTGPDNAQTTASGLADPKRID